MRKSRLQSDLYIGRVLCWGEMYLYEENSGRKHKNANGIWQADVHLALSSLLWFLSSVPLTITIIVRVHLAARNGSPIKRGLWENSGTSEGHLLLKNRDSFVLFTQFCWINLRVGITKIWIQAGFLEFLGSYCPHTISDPFLLPPKAHVSSSFLSSLLSQFISISAFFFFEGAVKTETCYVATEGLVVHYVAHSYGCVYVFPYVWKSDLTPMVSSLRNCPLECGG